jgi:signal transduction histidine kinase
MIRLRVRLRAKILLAFALVLLPVAILLWVDFRTSVAREDESVLRDHTLTAQAIALQVDEAFDALIGFGWAVANDPTVLTAELSEVDARMHRLVTRAPHVAVAAVYDARGTNRGWGGQGAPDQRTRASVADRPEFRQVMALNLPQISDVLPPERLGWPGLVATVPIRDEQDRPVGVVVVGAVADQLARRYEHARLLPGQAILLADRAGRLAFHTSRRAMTWEDSAALLESEPLRAALAGINTTDTNFRAPFGGEASLAAFMPSPKYRWGIGVIMPRDIAMAPLEAGFRRQALAFGGILLVSVGLAALFARLLVDPVRRLEAAATALGHGDLTRRVNLDTGDELGRLGAAFDHMAAQLTKVYDEQRLTLRLHEDFMQAAAHELKTPLSTIRSSVHLLMSDPHETQRRTLEIIRRQAKRMTLLVEDLLTVARLGSSLPELRRARLDLARVCDEAVRRASELAEKHDITLASNGPLPVEADAELVDVVMVRLLENAIGAAPEGGPIEVSTRREERDAVVTVADHGVGIPLDRQPHIFEPFYEAVPSGRPGYVGVVSLRLHLCRRILDAHGGRIWFESTPHEGSTFSFSLPLSSN